MIRRLLDYIRAPDSYHGRPWAYLANQTGHLALGALLALAAPSAGLPAMILIYVAAVELPQATLWGGSVSDGIEDAAHVTAGALAVATGWPALAVSALMIATGVAWRHEQNQIYNQKEKKR